MMSTNPRRFCRIHLLQEPLLTRCGSFFRESRSTVSNMICFENCWFNFKNNTVYWLKVLFRRSDGKVHNCMQKLNKQTQQDCSKVEFWEEGRIANRPPPRPPTLLHSAKYFGPPRLRCRKSRQGGGGLCTMHIAKCPSVLLPENLRAHLQLSV